MKNFFKGFVVGIGKIIPGVSGAMIAISMGIYDKCAFYICNFKDNKKESIKFLFPIVLGIILSIVFFSKIIYLCLDKFYLITMLFFIGLIVGGVPMVVNKVNKKDCCIVIISFVIFFLLSISSIDNTYVIKNSVIDYVIFFISGIVEAIGTVVPGISSTALLMIMGTYDNIITSIANLNNIKIIIPFTVGLVMGIVICVRIISYLFNKCGNKVYAFTLGVLLSSIMLLIVRTFRYEVNIIELVIGIIFMIVGIFISNLLEEK